MGWNVRGKSLEALQDAWDLLDLEDMDFICLQELGGLGSEPGPFGRAELSLGHREFTAFSCNPPKIFFEHCQFWCLQNWLPT